MARTNTKPRARVGTGTTTFEGGPARILDAEPQLKRAVLSCLLWEDTFYESGQDIATRIKTLTSSILSERRAEGVAFVRDLMIDARQKHRLRHAPLWLLASMIDAPIEARPLYRSLVPQVVQRADEMGELLAMYWKDGKRPLPAQLQKGLAEAFPKFDHYQLAKYSRESAAIKPRDVMFLTHPTSGRKGYNRQERRRLADVGETVELSEQEQMWAKLATDTLESPDTWEVGLSGGADKKETFERLIRERKLGGLATIRNLRNMVEAGVDRNLIVERLNWIDSRAGILPYQFVTAARFAPSLESEIEGAMLRSISDMPKLPGNTVLLIDVSGSMDSKLSQKGDMTAMDAACGLAILAREICEKTAVFAFSNECKEIPARHGFALRDAIKNSMPHGGTNLGAAIAKIQEIAGKASEPPTRIIVFTDEQAHDRVGGPGVLGKGYMVNVAPYKYSVDFGQWVRVSGFSEATMDFVREIEPVV